MDVHDYVLKSYFYKLRDTLKDSWYMYNDAEVMKDFGDKEESKHCINDVICRLNGTDALISRLNNYMNRHNIPKDKAYEVLYNGLLEDLDMLKDKVKKFQL